MTGRIHSREFKLQLVRQIENGTLRPAQACREHNIANSLLMRWRKEYRERGEEAFTPRQPTESQSLEARIAELERFCGRLALENAVLKKALQLQPSRRESDTL